MAKCKLVSTARKTGTSKAGKQFDFIVLYGLFSTDLIKSDNYVLSGYPVELREIPISTSRWNDMCNIPINQIVDCVGSDMSVDYDIKSINGVVTAVVKGVEL
jgi:hypothetical protein